MSDEEDEQLPVTTPGTELIESEEDDPGLDSILARLDLPRDTFSDYSKARDTLVGALEAGRIATRRRARACSGHGPSQSI